MKFTPESRVYLLGIALCAALIICSRTYSPGRGPYFMASLSVAGMIYLLAVREFFTTPIFKRRVVVFGLLLAAVWNIALVCVPAGVDDDIHRYVWDGRLQHLGYNPYLVIPDDPSVSSLHTDETRTLNNPSLPSPYPPGAQIFFRAVTAIHESALALKIAFVVCEFAIAFLLLDVLRSRRLAPHLVLIYAWSPLLAIEVAGNGHIDIVGALLLVVSVAALARRWRSTAALAFGFAVAVKFLPIVLLPLYWKRIRIRDAMLAAVAVALLYLPFLNHGRIPIGSLGTYVQSFRFNGPVFALLDRVAPPQLLAGVAVLAGLATAIYLRHTMPEWSPGAFAWPMAATLLCAPAVFPWYLLWLLPFLTSASTLLIVVWTVCIFPTYIMWHLRPPGSPFGSLPVWVMLAEYGCLAFAAAIIALRRRSRPVTLKSPPGPQD
jgi:alpha-1,6-mannosyltransferase